MQKQDEQHVVYCYRKISSFVRKNQIFDKPQPKYAPLAAANFLWINNVRYNLKSRVCHFFFILNVQYFRYWKSKKIYCYRMHSFIQESCSVLFKHFRVLLAACVINFHLEHSFYINTNKNIISCFNTPKMLFVILLPISYKKDETSLISY